MSIGERRREGNRREEKGRAGQGREEIRGYEEKEKQKGKKVNNQGNR